MKFGEKLQTEAWPEWWQHYVNYELLKSKLKAVIEARDSGSDNLLDVRKKIFQGILDEELSKVLAFFKQKSALVSSETQHALSSMADEPDDGAPVEERAQALHRAIQRLEDLAESVTHLLGFVSLNMAAVRKILKKFKKHVEPLAPIPGFLSLEIGHPHDPNYKISTGTFLPESKAADLADMNQHAALTQCAGGIRETYNNLREQRRALLAAASEEERRQMQSSASATALEDFEEALHEMQDAEELSRRNAALVHQLKWSDRQAGIFTKPPPEEKAVGTDFGLLLMCTASCLYIANYQLCLPTVTAFCQHLNVPASYAGYVVGATDVAAIPIAIVYSVWSNHSFKQPLLFAAIACALSNLLYCTSYDWGGFLLLSIARFLTGLGSARSICRRYISDFVPTAKRTAAATAFVCSSACGMALGPLLSYPLQQLPETEWHGIHLGPITAAGYIMAAAWLLYAAVCCVSFQDPLVALREREAAVGEVCEVTEPLLRQHSQTSTISRMEAALPQKQRGGKGGGKQHTVEQQRMEQESWRASLPVTAVAIVILWALKMVQQGYMSGLSVTTSTFFDWNAGEIGLLLTALGISAMPVTAAVGYVSSWVPDRYIITGSAAVTSIGCLALAISCDKAWAYFGGGTLVFLGTLIMEGAGMSLLSKIIHPRLQQGVLNAGLLATEAGTVGRLTGNAAVSVFGRITGTESWAQVVQFERVMYFYFICVLGVVQGGVLALWQKFIV